MVVLNLFCVKIMEMKLCFCQKIDDFLKRCLFKHLNIPVAETESNMREFARFKIEADYIFIMVLHK